MAPELARGGRAHYLDAEAQAWLVAYAGQHPPATLAKPGQAKPGRRRAGGRWAKPALGKCCKASQYPIDCAVGQRVSMGQGVRMTAAQGTTKQELMMARSTRRGSQLGATSKEACL